MSFKFVLHLIGRVLSRISDLLVAQNWNRVLALFFSGGPGRVERRIRSKMTDDVDVAIDLNDPYLLKPLFLTELAFADSDSDEDQDDTDPQQPQPRSGHRIVCIGNHSVYAFGGYNPVADGRMLFGELWRFDLNSYRWHQVLGPDHPGMPQELASMAMCASGNYILIYGGSGLPFGQKNSNRLHICDTTTDPPTMREIETTGEKPQEMYGQAMLIHEGYLYVVGGTSGHDYACDIHRLDLQTRSWTMIGPSRPNTRAGDPAGRYRHELATDGEHILVLGGGTTTETFELATLPAFHLESEKWIEYQTKPDPRTGEYPQPRKFHSLVQCASGQVFISGGCTSTTTLRDIWRLDLNTRTWTKLEKCRLPYRMFFHSAGVTADGCMFIFGGIRDRAGPIRTNNLYKLWLSVPPLKAMSAEAVRYWLRVDVDEEDPKSVVASFKALPNDYRQYLL